jgi:hypothetical protein
MSSVYTSHRRTEIVIAKVRILAAISKTLSELRMSVRRRRDRVPGRRRPTSSQGLSIRPLLEVFVAEAVEVLFSVELIAILIVAVLFVTFQEVAIREIAVIQLAWLLVAVLQVARLGARVHTRFDATRRAFSIVAWSRFARRSASARNPHIVRAVTVETRHTAISWIQARRHVELRRWQVRMMGKGVNG